MDNYIAKDSDGSLLVTVESIPENKAQECSPLTHCLAVVRIEDDYLLGWNKWRQRWEIFGGCLESGETPGDCIRRECREELGLTEGVFSWLGVMNFWLMPDYFFKEARTEYGGLYGITVHGKTVEEIAAGMQDRDEVTKLALYRDVKGKEPVAILDEALLMFYT
ncbi:MAG: NUDIX domain-containing protein [Clostridia bacterium]|nr:NUDIX domain-containing protein [Clostridia bacterium]